MTLLKRWRWKLAQAAEIRWWRNYLRNRQKEAYLEQKKQYWHRVLHAMDLTAAPGAEVLDAGCGPAGIFMVLDACQVTALDPLLDAYAQQLTHFSPNSYPHVRFLCLPLEDYAEERRYDRVFCLNAINHVSDLSRCVQVLVRALSPGGKLLLGVDVHRKNWLKRIFRVLPGDVLHPHQHGMEDYNRLFADEGLTLEKSVCLKKGSIFNYQLMLFSREG